MAHKHLHELLKEDQEPFHLQTYISERRCQLKPPRHASFSPFHHKSSHIWKSQFQESPSPLQKTTILLPVSALLLEAAMRVEKKQGSFKNRTKMKNSGFGILGFVLKKLKDLKNSKTGEHGNSKNFENGEMEERSCDETSFSCNSNNHDSNVSTTLSSFSAQTSPSSSLVSPELSSPATSPNQKATEGSNNGVVDEESEQCSPVSVLETPFEDDHVSGDEDANEDEFEDDSCDEDDYDDHLECSFAIVQEAKEQLLDKLRRFEKLAELDPVELERRMMEEEEDSDEEENNEGSMSFCRHGDGDTLALSMSAFKHSRKLVSDLMEDENDEKYGGLKNKGVMVRLVSRRPTSFKEVEPKEIDSMVKLDFGRAFDSAKNYVQEYDELANEIEVALFHLLIEEVTEELTNMKGRPTA